jgi:outer membrane receptor protein involved in Fe transport
VKCAGLYGNICGIPNPEWRHQARVTWTGPHGIGASLRWRYFSGVDIDGTASQPELAHIGSQNYFDLALTFRMNDHYSFRLGANNLFDREPPITAAQACPAGICNGNAFSQVYDALGRYIYAGVTLDF